METMVIIVSTFGDEWGECHEFIEIPTGLEAQIVKCLEEVMGYEVIGHAFKSVVGRPIAEFWESEQRSLVRNMLPYGLGREKFQSFADAEDWYGWKEMAFKEIGQQVTNEGPYYKTIPDPNVDPKLLASATMCLIKTDEIIPDKSIFEHRWQGYEKRLAEAIPKYTTIQKLLRQLYGELQ